MQKAKQDIDEKIAEAYLPRVPAGVDLQVEIRVGQDYKTSSSSPTRQDVDLIILGRQGHGALEKVLFGNVTEKVARKAGCAVLIIPLDFQKKHLH